MPRVPTYDSLTVTPTTTPTNYFHTPDLHAEMVGRDAMQMGNALTNAGEGMSKIATDMAQDINATRLDEASLQLREAARKLQYGQQTLSGQTDPGTPTGYSQLKGKDALDRPDGQSLAEEYGSLLQQHVSKISDGLGNEAQKAAFAHYATGFQAGFQDDVWRHTFAEQRTYGLSVAKGNLDEAMNTLKDNYTNPMAVQGAIDQVKRYSYRAGQLNGLSVPEIDAETRKALSNAHQTVVTAYLSNNDPTGADAYYKAHAKEMRLDESLSVLPHIREGVAIKQATAAVDYAINKASPPGRGQLAYQALLPVEGGVDKDGKFLTSPKGAIGPAQMLLTTGPEAAKLAGVPWDEQKFRTDAKYNNTLGLAWINDMIRKFDGDPAKGYAAYNAGEGATRSAIKKAETSGGNWLEYLPKETQNYVPKAIANFEKLTAGGPRKLDPMQVDGLLREVAGDNPLVLKNARLEAEKRLKVMNDSIEQTEQHNYSVAVDWLVQNKMSLAQAPYEIRSAIPRDKWTSAQSAADAILKGQTDWGKYAEISAQSVTDPVAFKSRDLRLDFPYLGESQRKQLLDLQAKLKDPQQAPQIADLNAQIKSRTMSWTDKDKIGRFESAVRNAVAAETADGKKLTYQEREKLINRLLLPVDSGHWYTSNQQMWETIGTAGENKGKPVISGQDRDRIVAQLSDAGLPVTEANITTKFNEIYGIR